MKSVLIRKLGTVELLSVLGVVELVVGSGARALACAVLAIGFHYGRQHFKGDFSLADLRGLVSSQEGKKT